MVRGAGLCVWHRLPSHHLPHLSGPLPEDLQRAIRLVSASLTALTQRTPPRATRRNVHVLQARPGVRV